jgi:hypothetical protein
MPPPRYSRHFDGDPAVRYGAPLRLRLYGASLCTRWHGQALSRCRDTRKKMTNSVEVIAKFTTHSAYILLSPRGRSNVLVAFR